MEKHEIELQLTDMELDGAAGGSDEFTFELLEARMMLLDSDIGICTSTSTSCDCSSSSTSCC